MSQSEQQNRRGVLQVLQGCDVVLTSGEDNFEKTLDSLKKKVHDFCNLKNVYFLFGAGTSSGAIPTMKMLSDSLEDAFDNNENDIREEYDRVKINKKGDLEACLSVLYSARAYFEGIVGRKRDDLTREYKKKLVLYEKLIRKIEKHIFKKINIDFDSEEARSVLKYYQTFYQKLARRNRDNSRICVFTTNNDLFNEVAMDSLNINYINGFGGGLIRMFNPALFNHTWSKRMDTSIDKYEPIENLVYLYKLHGSINWRESKVKENTFFEIEEVKRSEVKPKDSVLIYPTPTKQDKSLGSPYVDLFREFQNKLLEPHSVLFVIGYSFSDRHVNEIIHRALATNSSLNVVIFGDKPNDSPDERTKRPIFFVNDRRVFIINGNENRIENSEGQSTEGGADGVKINHFDYIVRELIPDLDAYKKDYDILKDFINNLKRTKKGESR